jgi:DNA-directed RNA polymerase sigma subunit (sigma70/sigma32)
VNTHAKENSPDPIDLVAFCGSQELADRVRKALDMVDGIALKLQGRGLSLLALTAHGGVGLVSAVESFDGTAGREFSEYAPRIIERAMRRALADGSLTAQVARTAVGL